MNSSVENQQIVVNLRVFALEKAVLKMAFFLLTFPEKCTILDGPLSYKRRTSVWLLLPVNSRKSISSSAAF